MEKIDILLWIVAGGFTVTFSMMKMMWNDINRRFEKVDQRFDKMENRIQNLENDMIEVKTILRMKEYCMIQDERHIKKAE